MKRTIDSPARPTRRTFLTTSALLATSASASLGAHVAGSDVIKIGLIGCGKRGTDAAVNAMNAGPDVQITALGELFKDRLEESRAELKAKKPDQFAVKDDHCFLGFDAYKNVLATDIDAVLIAASSHFHPEMLTAAVAANKHIFCEKPHGIDVPGVKISMKAAEEARQKKLSLVSGLCWRYDLGVQETMKRVLDGAIGRIVAIHESYLSSPYVVRERQPGWSEMEYQLRNWYHFNWLSGDQTSQQLIHSIDKSSWALGDKPPLKAWGLGGRQVCIDPKYGDQYDHHAVVFEYDEGVRVFGYCRDMPDCYRETSDFIMGTKGRCNLLENRIEGETTWHYEGPKPNMYDLEHKALFDSIRSGKPINNGTYMCVTTLLGIVAQMVCYSGAMITWEKALESTRSFALPRYGLDVEPPLKPNPDGTYPSAMPGPRELGLWQG
jgi:predicted dehydrogenase